MNVEDQIRAYLDSLPEGKRGELETLHRTMLEQFPGQKLWFETGKNAEGKVVANPSIGYGAYTIKYADGSTREFYRIGLSANSSGISVYVMGLDDKTYLAKTYGKTIGKAAVTGYCIRFKSLKVIDQAVLDEAIRFGMTSRTASN